MKKYPDSKVEMKLVKVTEHVYYVQGAAGMATENEGFISNAGVIITKDGVVLLDALGSPSLAKMLMQKIREVTDKPVKKVIVTHYHADHIYGLQLFKELGAEIYAPLAALDYLGSPTSAERLEERRLSLDPWVNDDTQLVSPDHKLNSNLKFNFGGLDFEITFVGSAHSEGDLTLYVAQDRVLFSGDIIFEGRVPFLGDANTKTWLATLEKMKTANLTALIPGHGPAARDPNQALLATAGYLAFMRDKMGAAAQDFVPFAEAYKKTDWSAYEKLPAFEAANRRNAYQVYLSMEAELMQQ
ncbi:MAG: MBL fold metallo-hydrolase [Gammaproteobacteria bacterium]|nr:MBL fold metallo-hydrolase [Gammaproteobacteria bacterium]MDH5652194.1 MBL fold metallo-hydrolase [Gammaproteobacteria bacterium]